MVTDGPAPGTAAARTSSLRVPACADATVDGIRVLDFAVLRGAAGRGAVPGERGRPRNRALLVPTDVVVANLPRYLAQTGPGLRHPEHPGRPHVLVAATAYGTRGHSASRWGFHSVGQAMSGAMYLSGIPAPELRAAVITSTSIRRKPAAMGAITALWARERTRPAGGGFAARFGGDPEQRRADAFNRQYASPNRIPQGNRGYAPPPCDVFATQDSGGGGAGGGRPCSSAGAGWSDAANLQSNPSCRRRVARHAPQPGHQRRRVVAWCAGRGRAGTGGIGRREESVRTRAPPAAGAGQPPYPRAMAVLEPCAWTACPARPPGTQSGEYCPKRLPGSVSQSSRLGAQDEILRERHGPRPGIARRRRGPEGTPPMRILVFGGGVIRTCCAYYLAKSGHQVGVLDTKETTSNTAIAGLFGASAGACGEVK